MSRSYYIEGFPVPFHDLVEVFEFLLSLSVKTLYLFSCSRVFLDDVPLMWIIVFEKEIAGRTYVTYREFPRW